MNHFATIVRTLWALHPQRFWMLWFTTTGFALTYVLFLMQQQKTAEPQNRQTRSFYPLSTEERRIAARTTAALIFLILFLSLYVAMILLWEDFTYYDNDVFMLYTLITHNFPPPIWSVNGRFFPFGLIEFNLIRHFTHTPTGYFLFPTVETVLLTGIVLLILQDFSVAQRIVVAILVLLTPSILLSLDSLIFEERNVLVLIAGLSFSVKQFEKTKAVGWAVAAVMCGQIMLYFKETSFLILLGFGAARLIMRCRNAESSEWDYRKLSSQESRLDFCLIALAFFFLASYFTMMGIHGNMNYAIAAHYPTSEVISDYLKLDLLIWVFTGVFLYRAYRIARRRTSPSLLWDGLACGGVCYFFGFLALGMCTAYYLAPADFIAVVYLGRLTLSSWDRIVSWKRLPAIAIALIIVFQNLSLSAFTIFEMKNLIHAKVQLANVVLRDRHAAALPSLYFPFATPYRVMEFMVYLNYRGLPLHRALLSGANNAKDAPCVNYRPLILCQSRNRPAPGDLVIVLPDDEVSLAQAAPYRRPDELSFLYEPRPAIARWLYPLATTPLATDAHRARPDRWMDASVAVWK